MIKIVFMVKKFLLREIFVLAVQRKFFLLTFGQKTDEIDFVGLYPANTTFLAKPKIHFFGNNLSLLFVRSFVNEKQNFLAIHQVLTSSFREINSLYDFVSLIILCFTVNTICFFEVRFLISFGQLVVQAAQIWAAFGGQTW